MEKGTVSNDCNGYDDGKTVHLRAVRTRMEDYRQRPTPALPEVQGANLARTGDQGTTAEARAEEDEQSEAGPAYDPETNKEATVIEKLKVLMLFGILLALLTTRQRSLKLTQAEDEDDFTPCIDMVRQ